MTVVAFASIKGAPGVTTGACLVGATWPAPRKVAVAECDSGGSDLAARFGLSSKCGWSSLATAARRSHSDPELAPHLQRLPGGLDVLVGSGTKTPGTEVGPRAATALLASAASDPEGPWDLLIDLGRVHPGDPSPIATAWLERCDTVALVLRTDAASVMHVRDGAPDLRARCGDRIGLVVITTDPYPGAEIERFTGLPVIGEIPFDQAAAKVASGGHGSRRRLSRSSLVTSSSRLATTLVAWDPEPLLDPLAERRLEVSCREPTP